MAIVDDIKRKYRQGTMLMRIIYINIGVFVLVHLVALVGVLINVPAQELVTWLQLPSALPRLSRQPWSVVTYMFTHYDLLHILFNMLWLYWLGRIFLEYFTPKRLSALYVLGGLGGAALYLLAMSLLPHFVGHNSFLTGASASVIAIVVAVAVWAPDYKIGLLFIGEVALKWVAIVTIGIDLLSVDAGNAGGHIAHLGGAAVGAIYATALRRGTDITRPINAALDWLASLLPQREPGVGQPVGGKAFTGGGGSAEPTEAQIDAILDKIKRSGYTSLTDRERDMLFRASRKK
ncbi:MAG: rhomboid family intramembrane serine protease [Muribaculaceae bacterium]|nr:rhomboid family intramembrane serine protease [Muribaculaceae bacterium]